jgi:membrane-associated protease RseP (regulator of RpoE activity)
VALLSLEAARGRRLAPDTEAGLAYLGYSLLILYVAWVVSQDFERLGQALLGGPPPAPPPPGN